MLESRNRVQLGAAEGSDVSTVAVDHYRTIGVAGTHGRGTVTSMLAWILECAGRNPGFVISARHDNFGHRCRVPGGDWFVLELDDRLTAPGAVDCDFVVCNFLELDAETGGDSEGLVDSMRRFLESNPRLKEAFVNLDCLGNRKMVEGLALRPTGYAMEHRAEFRGSLEESDSSGLSFRAAHRDRELSEFRLQIPGTYNAVNALGALAVAHRLSISIEVVAEALATYRGLENRYTVAGGGGVTIVKDRAHRPSAMSNVVDTARRALEGRLYSVLEGRRLLRDAVPGRDLGEALSECDEVTLVRSGDDDGLGAEERRLAQYGDAFDECGVEFGVRCSDEAGDYLQEKTHPGDKVLFFGSDDFLRTADHLRANIASEAAQTPEAKEQPRLDGPLIDGDE